MQKETAFRLKIGAACLCSFLAGALFMSFAWARTVRAIVEPTIFNYATEQQYLAARAAYNNDVYAEIVHARNSADARIERPPGFAYFIRIQGSDSLWNMLMPWYELRWQRHKLQYDPQVQKRGRESMRAIALARLAIAFEKAGVTGQAESAWTEARAADPKKREIQELRQVISEIDDSYISDEGHRLFVDAYVDIYDHEEIVEVIMQLIRDYPSLGSEPE